MRLLFSSPVRRLVVAMVVVGGLFGAVIVLPMLGMFASLPTDALGGDDTTQQQQECLPTVETAGRQVSLDTEQLTNAATIIRVGNQLGVPLRGIVVAIATAMQESTLKNLGYGDRDSQGLFQQRPVSGWGSPSQITSPEYAIRAFFGGPGSPTPIPHPPGLLDVSDWQQMPIWKAAQTVQRSAFPFAYAKWETLAAALVKGSPVAQGQAADAGCGDIVRATLPDSDVGDMLRSAMAQIGDPYVWGATGPDAFDCSGLVVYAWRQAGYRLSVRTAAQMSNLATPVAPGQERPGDLYFGEFGTRVAGAGHVMIVISPGLAVQAPATGRDVTLTRYDVNSHPGWRIGRLPASALQRLPGFAAAG